MSERNGPDLTSFSDVSLGASSFGEKRYFVEPVFLEQATSMADAVMYTGVAAGGGVLVAGIGIGRYFWEKASAVERKSKIKAKEPNLQASRMPKAEGTE